MGMKTSPFNKAANNAMRIARTEGHRMIQQEAAMDGIEEANKKGADVVKQWDSTLDSNTRESHQKCDGEIRELDEKFSNGLRFPGDPHGAAAEVINCRCCVLQRSRAVLDKDELETLQKRAEYFGLDKTNSFEEYKEKYLNLQRDSDTMKMSFPEEVYKIDGVTEEVKAELDRAISKLESEYYIKLNSILVESAGKGDIFITGYHDGVVDMVVNRNADFEKIIRRIPSKYKMNYFAGKSLEDYIAHEMAHCMLYQDCTSDAEYRAKYEQIESLFSKLQGVSGYADKTKSGNEALAEAFVRVRNGEKVDSMVKILVESYYRRMKK